jgi:hypothetical protein
VPVKVTEQLVTPVVVERLHDVADKLPPVVPAVSVKVTAPVGAFVAVVVSTTVALTEAVQLDPPSEIVQLTLGTLVEVLSLDVEDTVTVAAVLVLALWVASPPYEAAIDPEPAAVPVNVTEQVPAERLQVVALKEPPVEPAVNVKVTVPVGVFAGVVVSATVATTLAVQLVPLSAIVQLTAPTLVDVLSLPVAVTVTEAAELVLVL